MIVTVSTLALLGHLLPCVFLTEAFGQHLTRVKPGAPPWLRLWAMASATDVTAIQLPWQQPCTYWWINMSSLTETALPRNQLELREAMEEGSSVSPHSLHRWVHNCPVFPGTPCPQATEVISVLCPSARGEGSQGPLESLLIPGGKSHSPTLASWFLLF